MARKTKQFKTGKKAEPVPTVPPRPQASPALRLAFSLLLLGLAFSLVLQPTLRMMRLALRQDGFERQKLSFSVDGVEARWGYAGWSGLFSMDLIQKFKLPYPAAVVEAVTQPPLLNQNILGGPLVINGTTFPNGVGTHAPSKIAFELAGKFRRFTCQVGVDATSSLSPGVVYVLLADGKEIYRSPKLKSDADPFPIDVPVTGVKELVLFVDNCEFSNSGSNVDWVDLKFEP